MDAWRLWVWIFFIIFSLVIFAKYVKKDYVDWYLHLPNPKPKGKKLEVVGLLFLGFLISITSGVVIAQIVSVLQEVFGY